MKGGVGFFGFWYDFLVGDDWTLAVGVAIALGLTALLARIGAVAWLWLPLAVALLLAASVWRAARSAARH